MEDIFARVRAAFPSADVKGSTLDAFSEALLRSEAAKQLPIVFGEIGDSWIYGASFVLEIWDMIYGAVADVTFIQS